MRGDKPRIGDRLRRGNDIIEVVSDRMTEAAALQPEACAPPGGDRRYGRLVRWIQIQTDRAGHLNKEPDVTPFFIPEHLMAGWAPVTREET